jgi:glycerol-3-phosphate cytidylyltransferase-like family protein
MESQRDVTILMPGGFKPLHMGHIHLFNTYLQHPRVKEIILLIGPGVRDNITQSDAIKISNMILKGYDRIRIEEVSEPSPVSTAYNYIAKAKPGIYAMGCSTKGDDYKRVQMFVSNYKEKYTLPESVDVIELSVDAEPAVYTGRNDKFNDWNGKPISANILRQDVLNRDFQNFYTNYCTDELSFDNVKFIEALYDMLVLIVDVDDKHC